MKQFIAFVFIISLLACENEKKTSNDGIETSPEQKKDTIEY